ncbi:MAG: transketolase family protein [Clostridia bacterium]|nr:transketolase family protein [Clostridia bacterium]
MKIIYNGEMENVLLKEVLGKTLPRLAEEDPDVVYLDADLMSCIGTAKWAATCDRAINCGIAEANMAGVAAGLAAQGFKPYIHTFGIFASRRCFDQVFLAAGYTDNAITVIGTDPGVTAAYNGGTHMPFEDIGIYRTLPGATIIDITDGVMLENVLEQVKDMPGVKYIRCCRKGMRAVFEPGSKFEIGKAIEIRPGKDAVVFASGIMVHETMQAALELEKEGISVAVVNIYTIKPIDEEAIVKYASETGAVVVAENHNKMGGLCSAVSEVLVKKCPTPAEFVAVEDEFGEVGPQPYLQERFGLTKEHVVEAIKAAIARKK